MVDEGLLELGNQFHMQCIWFSFSDLLQFELNNFAERWNRHHFRSSKPSYCSRSAFYFPRRVRIYQLWNTSFIWKTRSFEVKHWHWDRDRDRERINYIWPRGRYSNVLLYEHCATFTYTPTNRTEAKDLFSKINISLLWIFIHIGTIKNVLLDILF